MVKKKKAKRVVKKNKKPMKSIKSTGSAVGKRDFEAFKFGIQRLKELRKELDTLDTRGFSKEEQSIRLKLKNVSEIPNIEKSIKILRLKIDKKYKKPKKRKSVIKENIKDIKEDIPEIKAEIRKLGRKFEESKLKKKGSIDSGVGILVDTNFNNFLKETKLVLSNRIRSREKEVNDVLEADLQKRENNFKEKHLNLIRDFNERKRKLEREFEKKYSKKVKTSLQKEISEKFNYELQQKLNAEKIKLSKGYIAELREHAKEKLDRNEEKLKEKLEKELEKEIAKEKKEKEKEMKKIKTRKDILENQKINLQKSKEIFATQKEEERKKIKEKIVKEAHEQLEKDLVVKEKEIRSQLRNEFELRLKKQIQEHEVYIKKKKLDLELEMQKKIKQVLS